MVMKIIGRLDKPKTEKQWPSQEPAGFVQSQPRRCIAWTRAGGDGGYLAANAWFWKVKGALRYVIRRHNLAGRATTGQRRWPRITDARIVKLHTFEAVPQSPATTLLRL